VFVILPDGSCIPATKETLKIVMRQSRSEASKRRRLKAKEKADELQRNLEDRAAARRYLQELAEIDLERRRMAATLRARVKADRPSPQTSDVVKRSSSLPSRGSIAMTQVPSSWVVDDFGMRGVHYSQSYIGRKSPGFYRDAARDRWLYEARDEAVLRGVDGEPVIVANIGDDLDEIGTAWQAIEDATTRLNGKIQIRIIVAFDADASDVENITALKHFCDTVLAPLGLPYSAVIHRAPDAGDARNVHAHILTNFRPTERVAPYCWSFADHVRGELDGRDGVQMMRHLWAHSMSEAAERAQRNMLYTGLGYGARGLNLEAGEHLGEMRSAISRRGDKVWAEERNRIKLARNAARQAIRDADKKIAALTALRDSLVAQAVSERAGNLPERRLVTVDARRRSSRTEPLMASRRLHQQRASERTVASQSEHHHAPLVASRRSSYPALIQGSADEQAPLAPRTAGLSPAAKKPLERSAESIAHVPLTAIGTSDHTRRLSPVKPRASASSPLELPVTEMPAATAKPLSSHELRPADRLSLSTIIGSPDPTDRVGRNLLAALARWREAQTQGPTIDTPTAPTKSKAPLKPVQPDERDDNSAAPRTIPPPFVSAYRRRRLLAKPVRLSKPTEVLPTREWLEDNPRASFGEDAVLQLTQDEHLIVWLRKVDAYVADFGSGRLELDPQVAAKLKIDDKRLQRPHLQRELAAIRDEQQQALAELVRHACERPLAFDKVVDRFWPSDLNPTLLRRVERWHMRDGEGLWRDLWPVQRRVREAHRRHELAKAATASRGSRGAAKGATPPSSQGGQKAGYRPVKRIDTLAELRIPPFTNRGQPSRSLVLLIRHAGEHPDDIVIGSGALSVSAQTPEMIENLLDQWRGNDRVMRAVADTIARSKAAGRPEWPAEFVSALRPPATAARAPNRKRYDAGRSR
jgi:hypothetical protein